MHQHPWNSQSVSSDALRTRLRTLLDDVAYGHQHVHVNRYGKPAAVLVDVSWYETRQDVGELGNHREPPASPAQAFARVVYELDHFKMACDDGIDVRYARECLEGAVSDYIEYIATGEIQPHD